MLPYRDGAMPCRSSPDHPATRVLSTNSTGLFAPVRRERTSVRSDLIARSDSVRLQSGRMSSSKVENFYGSHWTRGEFFPGWVADAQCGPIGQIPLFEYASVQVECAAVGLMFGVYKTHYYNRRNGSLCFLARASNGRKADVKLEFPFLLPLSFSVDLATPGGFLPADV